MTTGSLLMFVGGTLIKEALGGVLINKLLATSSLLVFVGGTLINKALVGRRLEAMAFIFPQCIDCPLPNLVSSFHVGAIPTKNGPPRWIWWQQPSSLLVFTKASLNPFLFTK